MNDRYDYISDDLWNAICNIIPGSVNWPGKTGLDNRLFLNAVIWILRTGSPWRDLPCYFGNWNSVYIRYRRWYVGDHFERIFGIVASFPESGLLGIDGSMVKLHQHATCGVKKGNLEV
jgi:putative transposase